MTRLGGTLAMIALATIPSDLSAQAGGDRVERVSFAAGTSERTVRGRVRGYRFIDYLVGARAGQVMNVSLLTGNRSLYFLVRAPGSDDNLFDGPARGSDAELRLPTSGDYRIRVFLFRNAARRNVTADYTLRVAVE